MFLIACYLMVVNKLGIILVTLKWPKPPFRHRKVFLKNCISFRNIANPFGRPFWWNTLYKVIDLSKQQALDADPKAMKQIKFTGTLVRLERAIVLFNIEEVKETILDLKIVRAIISMI